MQDRIGDLRELALQKNPNAAEKMSPGPSLVLRTDANDIEAHIPLNEERSTFMDEFFQKTEAIKVAITNICREVDTFKDGKKKAAVSTSSEMEKESSMLLQKTLDHANRLVLSTKKMLEDLKEENRVFSVQNQGTSESRIRENLHQALTRRFRDILVEYQTVQTDYKQDVKDKVSRQVRIVFPEASDVERQQIVEEGEVTDLIRARITGVTAHVSMQNALSDLQDKYRDIRRLEENVQELHQLFVDLATLVDAQGEMLDQVEFSVNSAADYTEMAEKELVTARKRQKSAQKKMCWLSICFIVLAIIVLIPLMVLFLK